ncbi:MULTISPECIES: hypothetical protein [Burkholderia]|uniref:Uncharacterized protein n=1 Tax=Burkholderia aenigmatica TaxID=2015348 RepID=A0A6J5IZQ8_9BURK|nr:MULTISPECIES: hypothetical protein [Burkholderia]CAB3964815.1 hypothetical protein BLA3211_03080 [Burkholderia aenigmatica]
MTQSSCSRHGRDEREAEHEVCRWPTWPTAFTPFATSVSKAGGLVQTFIPDRKVYRPAIRLTLIAVLIVPLFAGCASTRSGTTPTAQAAPAAAKKPVPADLMPGEQIDYAGHRCGNPNLYVKTHNCLFPQRNSTP